MTGSERCPAVMRVAGGKQIRIFEQDHTLMSHGILSPLISVTGNRRFLRASHCRGTWLLQLCFVAFTCFPLRTATAIDFSIVNSFPTEPITLFAVMSISVDRDTLLLGSSDGSVVRVSKDGSFLDEVLPASLIAGVYPTSGKGLAAASSIDRLYAVPDGIFVFSSAGSSVGPLVIFGGGASYVGASFETKASGGILSLLWERLRIIVSAKVDPDGRLTIPVDRILLPESVPGSTMTGILAISDTTLFILSKQDATLFLVERGSQEHPEQWRSRLIAETSLAPLGITKIEDIAFDQNTQHLFVVAPDQHQVVELLIVPATVFHRGDPDESGALNLADVVTVLEFLFQGNAASRCLEASDTNNDGRIDVSDAVYLLSVLFKGGPAPPLPGPPDRPCGSEPDFADSLAGLGCTEYGACTQ